MKTPAQFDAEIAEALSGGKKKARAVRVASHPKVTGETVIDVPDPLGSSYRRTFRLRPADMKTNYGNGGQVMMVMPAKRTDDTWLILTKSGMYVGVLQEGSGANPWNVYKLRQERGSIGQGGEEIGMNVRYGATWQEAIARGWWNT